MGKLLAHREPRPGETFLGGSGILTPYRPRQTSPSQIPASPLPTGPISISSCNLLGSGLTQINRLPWRRSHDVLEEEK